MKTERELATMLNPAICRCGSIHPPEELIMPDVDALYPIIHSVVACCRESHRRTTYLDVVHYAKYEKEAV